MAIDEINFGLLEPSNAPTQPELLISAVLHLMSNYTLNTSDNGACVKLASVIERHLKALANLPALTPVLQATCEQLSEQWAAIVERSMPHPEKRTFFSRLITSTRLN